MFYPSQSTSHQSPIKSAPSSPMQPVIMPAGSISFDVTPQFTSDTPTRPITLHTQSDSPGRHVTPLPPAPTARPALGQKMVVGQQSKQLDIAILKEKCPPLQPLNKCPATTSSPTVAQATIDQRKISFGLPLVEGRSHEDVWLSDVSGEFPPKKKLEQEQSKVLFSRIVSM